MAQGLWWFRDMCQWGNITECVKGDNGDTLPEKWLVQCTCIDTNIKHTTVMAMYSWHAWYLLLISKEQKKRCLPFSYVFIYLVLDLLSQFDKYEIDGLVQGCKINWWYYNYIDIYGSIRAGILWIAIFTYSMRNIINKKSRFNSSNFMQNL